MEHWSRAARKWRENEEMKRKWREIEEMEREWGNGERFTLNISSFSVKNCHILSQNVKYGTFVANVTKNLTHALWGNNSGLNTLPGSSASFAGLIYTHYDMKIGSAKPQPRMERLQSESQWRLWHRHSWGEILTNNPNWSITSIHLWSYDLKSKNRLTGW